MNPNNFVSEGGEGGYDVYTGGQYQGNYADQGAAEQAYNEYQGGDQQTGTNFAGAQWAMGIAAQAAQQAYLSAQLDFQKEQFNNLSAYQKEQMAIEKAQQAWEKTYQEASMTGTYNGQPTQAAQAQAASIAAQQAALTGVLGETPTLAGTQQQADLTGYYNGQATPAYQNQQNQTALGLMNLAAQLHGQPQDYFKYLSTLNGTPQGLQDVVGAMAGRFNLPGYGGGDPNARVQPASLQGMVGDVLGGSPYGGAQPGMVYAGGSPAGGALEGVGAGTRTANPALGGIYGTGVQTSDLISPSQWSGRNYNSLSPTQRDLLYGLYEDQKSMQPADAEALFRASLPRYTGARSGVQRMV